MRWNIDDVPVFVAVVEQNGVTAAARFLDRPKSTISQSITRLETALGVRLLERNSRKVRVTSEGETFYRQCQTIMDQVREADATMAGLTAVPSGRLSVATPPAFCQEFLAPNLTAFRHAYPEIDLDLTITTAKVDLLREQFDLAIVVGAQEDSELISKALLTGRLLWVTSPAYRATNDLGKTPEELVSHIQICEKRYGTRRFPVSIDGKHTHIDLSRNIIHVNDPVSVRAALLQGGGISCLPDRYCDKHLKSGELVEVFGHIRFDVSSSALSVVYPSRRLVSARTRAFLGFLDKVCRTA